MKATLRKALRSRFLGACIGYLGYIASVFPASQVHAGGGWYLMAPPVVNLGTKTQSLDDLKAQVGLPLSKWTQRGSYSSAAQCENDKLALTRGAEMAWLGSKRLYWKSLRTGETQRSILSFERDTAQDWYADEVSLISSLCIASDDPRLSR